MNGINQLLDSLKVEANVYHNGKFCGNWALNTSGSRRMSFHLVTQGQCFFKINEIELELFAGDAVFFPSDAHHVLTNTVAVDIPQNIVKSVPMMAQSIIIMQYLSS